MSAASIASLTGSDIAGLQVALPGGFIQPDDDNYRVARSLYNAMICLAILALGICLYFRCNISYNTPG